MVVEQMAIRCPGARLLGQASLAAHAFLINEHGVATVVPREGSTVWGVIWEITTQHEKELDYYEGVRRGLYAKERVAVNCPGTGAVEALIYTATNQRSGLPRPGYLESIIAAASYHKLPSNYVEFLRGCLRSLAG